MIVGPEGDAPTAAPTSAKPATRAVQLLTRRGELLLEPIAIPHFEKLPELVVVLARTFVLVDVAAEGVPRYRECFSYVVPEPGEPAVALSMELEELARLRTFKREILDPLLQPTKHGTILTPIVDKLFGTNASANAGAIARQTAAGLTR